METLKAMIREGNTAEVAGKVAEMLAGGEDPEAVLKQAMIPVMDEIGELFQKGELFVPEMLIAAKAMKMGLDVLRPALLREGVKPRGNVIIGTVRGDLHDIGKNLVSITLEGAGFEVIDLGVDVAPEAFVEALREYSAPVLGLSALLTTTMTAMKETIESLREAGLRDKVKVMIGGAPVTQEFADMIEADFYGPDAVAAKEFAARITA